MTDSGQAQDFGAGTGGDVVRLLNQARTSMKSRDYEAAKAGFKSIYDFLSRRGLGEGLEAMECLADLGATHMALKEYDAALTEYARLATIMERNLGEANAELRQHLRRYAQACDVAGKLNEAKQLYSRANDLERRYGAVPTRSSAGSLTGRLQSQSRELPPTSSGGSTFAEAIQDAVARSMAKLDNRGKPFEPQDSSKQTPAAPRPFTANPLPPSPFQNLVNEVATKGGAAPIPEPAAAPSESAAPPPQGFTGSPALPNQSNPTPLAQPGQDVPKELSDSQFIFRPKKNAGPEPPIGKAADGSALIIPWPSDAEQKAAAEAEAAEAAARLAQQEQEQEQVPDEWRQSGTHWSAPTLQEISRPEAAEVADAGTAGGAEKENRGGATEGNFEPVEDTRSGDYQSVEQSLDKVFGQANMPADGHGSSVYADPSGAPDQQATGMGGPGGMGYVTSDGNSPVRRTNPSLNSSKLRRMQNKGGAPEPVGEVADGEASGAESLTASAPLSYDPSDYDPSTPAAPYWSGPTTRPADEDPSRRPGARRASAEWQVEPSDDAADLIESLTEAYHSVEAHPDSDASKAMAQWGVTITGEVEERYPPIRQANADRRLGMQPVSPEVPPGAPKPFDRRQKPKSMKNLRNRFGDIEPPAEFDDAEFEDSDVMHPERQPSASGQFAPTASGDYAPEWQSAGNMQSQEQGIQIRGQAGSQNPAQGQGMPPPPSKPQRRTADNSHTNMTRPEMPGDRLTNPPEPPEMPPRGRGPRGLLERTGDHAELPQPDAVPEAYEEEPHNQEQGSMISRLVSKRQHDTSIQNARPGVSSEESQVLPRIRSMVDAARLNSGDGKHAEAARLLQRVVNELAEGGLKDSRYIADCMLLLSEAYEASGQLGPAVTSFHQHAMMVEKRVGVKDYDSIGNWYRLAALLDKANERDDARTMYEHALGLAAQHLDADDELTASIKQSYDEFLTNPERPAKRVAGTADLHTQEALAQNKELRTSALQQQGQPGNKRMIIWSVVSVIVLISAGIWFFILLGNLNKSIGSIDAAGTGGAIPEQLFANTDGDGLLRFTGTDTCEVTVDGKLRQVKYTVLKNDLSDLVTMFVNMSAKQTLWIRKAQDGMLVDENTMFYSKDSPELAMASEMRRIGQRVEEYYQTNRSYPRFRQDWSEDPAFGFLNPITHKGEASIFHVFPKSATQAALFGGFNTPDEIANFLEQGNTWVGEPELKPCSISVAVKHSGERSNGKPVVVEFYMHATDQTNKYLPASKPKTTSVVLLTQGRNIGNFDLHPKDLSKVELVPMPDAIAYVNMSESPLFTSDLLKSVVPVTFIGVAAIIFFGLLITIASLRSKKNTKKRT